jgi:hypothetical protein
MQNTNILLGLAMPSDFPVTEYLSISNKAGTRAGSAADVLQHFSGAWNAVVYRFHAVNAYQEALGPALEGARHGVVGPERALQERDLFGFFSNGFSVFEATFYGLYSLGALASPAMFPMTEADQRKINLSFTIDCIACAFPNDPIIQVLNCIKGDTDYASWSRIRNVLAHRVAPGRTFFVGGHHETPTWKTDDLPLTAAMLLKKRSELSSLLACLLQGVDAFAASRL